jgi:WD40 repeat protein
MDIKKDRLVREIKLERGYPCSVDWSPNGTQLVMEDSEGGFHVFTAEGQLLWRCKSHIAQVMDVSWAPNGRQIASASDDKTICVYDATSGEIMLRGEAGHPNWGITWSPDSKHLAWYVQDGGAYIVRTFDPSTGKPLLKCCGPTSIVWKVAWSPCGNRLASGSYDHNIYIRDFSDGSRLKCLEKNGETGSRRRGRRRDDAEENSIYSPIDLGGGFRIFEFRFSVSFRWQINFLFAQVFPPSSISCKNTKISLPWIPFSRGVLLSPMVLSRVLLWR